MLVENDPVLAVRKAVIDGMCRCGMQPEKKLVDAVADALPDFFRQPLQPVDLIGKQICATREPAIQSE